MLCVYKALARQKERMEKVKSWWQKKQIDLGLLAVARVQKIAGIYRSSFLPIRAFFSSMQGEKKKSFFFVQNLWAFLERSTQNVAFDMREFPVFLLHPERIKCQQADGNYNETEWVIIR